MKWTQGDLNSPPFRCERNALPTELWAPFQPPTKWAGESVTSCQ